MNRSSFPSMLKNQATLLGNFTRFDLYLVGGTYIVLSFFKVSGLLGLGINATLLLMIKLIQKQLPKGFFKNITGAKCLPWAFKLGEVKDE